MQYKWEAYPPAEGRSDHQVQRFTDTKNLQRCQKVQSQICHYPCQHTVNVFKEIVPEMSVNVQYNSM